MNSQYLKQLYKLEQKYYPQILDALKAYADTYASDIEKHGTHAALSLQHLKLFNDQLIPIIDSLYQSVGVVGAGAQYSSLIKGARGKKSFAFYALSVKSKSDNISKKAAGFGINLQWIQDVLKVLSQYALQFVQGITQTTKDDLRNILERGVAENQTIDEIAREMRNNGIVESRAQTITRTETTRAYNVGRKIGARSFPFEVNKKWVDAKDHRERHSHKMVGGQVVGENDLFKVPIFKNGVDTGQYDEMDMPCDPKASAGNTINCRCVGIFIQKEDANGNLILRQPNQAVVIPMRGVHQTPVEQIAAILKANIFLGVVVL